MNWLGKLTTLVLTLTLIPFQASADSEQKYCAALRGNGQMAPAQWLGMARIIEQRGMPTAMAGGSSSTLTMFFIESINKSAAINDLVDNQGQQANEKDFQALYMKSLPLFIVTVAKHLELDSTYQFLSEMGKSDSSLTEKIQTIFSEGGEDLVRLRNNLRQLGPLFNHDIASTILTKPWQMTRIRSRIEESIGAFGNFEAAKDTNLFFRPGLIDFKQFALSIGKAADFYSGHNVSEAVLTGQQNFLKRCAALTQGQILWPSDQEAQQSCQLEFAGLVVTHLQQTSLELDNDSDVFSKIGASIPSFPITAVLTGEGFANYQSTQSEYNNFETEDTGSFKVDVDDVRFGYWLPEGTEIKDSTELNAANQLTRPSVKFPGDLKSEKFFNIGSGNWFEVLATSPAEPGLTNLQMMPNGDSGSTILAESKRPIGFRWGDIQYREGMVSAGGWPDLHPTQLLQSYQPCQDADVVFLTRKGAASTFGQQTFIKITDTGSKIEGWEQPAGAHNYERFVEGTPAEDTDWHQLHNVTNPNSSFNLSLQNADLVLCTNWDQGNLFAENGFLDLVTDAYVDAPLRAPEDLNLTEHPGCTAYNN